MRRHFFTANILHFELLMSAWCCCCEKPVVACWQCFFFTESLSLEHLFVSPARRPGVVRLQCRPNPWTATAHVNRTVLHNYASWLRRCQYRRTGGGLPTRGSDERRLVAFFLRFAQSASLRAAPVGHSFVWVSRSGCQSLCFLAPRHHSVGERMERASAPRT